MKHSYVRRGAHWIVMSLFLTVAGCGGDSGTGNGDDGNGTGNGGGTGTTPVTTTSVTVGSGGNVFTPADILVSAGATVTWTWSALSAHNVTFDDSQVSAPSADRTAGTFQVVMPTAAATYDYLCTIHGSVMSGTVTVQ